MAKNPELFFSGRIGPVVMVKRGNKWHGRAYQPIVKQSAPTIVCSSNFGKASTAGKHLRNLLLPVIMPFDKVSSMQSKFMGCINRWLKSVGMHALPATDDISTFYQFDFNTTKHVVNNWQQQLQVAYPTHDSVQVTIPAFVATDAIRAPAKTTAIICTIIVACCKLTHGVALGSSEVVITYPYTNTPVPEQTITLAATSESDALIVTGVSVRYLLNDGSVNGSICGKEIYMPCGVIAAAYR